MNETTARVRIGDRLHAVVPGTRLSAIWEDHLPCGGHGKCGKCRVIARGALSAPSLSERQLLTADELAAGVRLACCTTVEGDCTVERIADAATDHRIMTSGAGELSAPAPAFARFGAAIDIGTTTLAAQLYDRSGRRLAEAGRMNPQAAWGADVISRIEASMRGEAAAMAASVCGAIDEMLTAMAADAGIAPADIDALVLTGNTAMLHLLTATSTEPLSHAPFAAERLFGETLSAGTIGLRAVLPEAGVYLPNCISAFVGADTVCALLAADLSASADTAMLVDIGTNGEMGLWHDGRLSVCSTAAGPAFEGVGISMGMNGAAGAVDHVTLCNGRLTAHVIGETAPRGICGSGLIDAVACLLDNETLDETGLLEDDPTPVAPPVVLTQADIRMTQLAKSAICAGIRTLLHAADISTDAVSRLWLAGGFGSYLNLRSAGRIGLLPAELTDRITVTGNAALAGAAMLLLDCSRRTRAAALAAEAEVVDLAANPVFANAYMEGMLFD